MTAHPRRRRGFTLIEAMVTTAITAVLVGIAVPSLRDMRERHHIDGVAAQLETDLMLARSEAVMRNQTVHAAFFRDDSGSCYVIHSGDGGDCRCGSGGALSCEGSAQVLRSAHLGGQSVQLRTSSRSLLFDAVKGTVAPTATIQVQGPAGTVNTIVNIMGRVRHCAATAGLPGYRRC